MNKSPHYFWAVRLPNPVKQKIHEELAMVKTVFQFKNWVHQEDYHITLAFLGAVDEQQRQSVITLVGDAIKNTKSFPLEIYGVNVFGNQKSPRVFWGAVNVEKQLVQLQEIVHKKCLEAGFTLESRAISSSYYIGKEMERGDRF